MNASAYSNHLPRPPGSAPLPPQQQGVGSGVGYGAAAPPLPTSRMTSQIPQGSKLATYMKGGYSNPPPPPTHLPPPPTMELKKLALSGIQEFVPSNSRNSPTPAGMAADVNGVAGAGGTAPGAAAAAGGGEAASSDAAAAAAAAAAAINAYNDGGTMYFYQGDEVMDPMTAAAAAAANGGSGAMVTPSSVMSANYTMFQGTPNFVSELRTQSNLPQTALNDGGASSSAAAAEICEIKADILKRQSICLTQADPESNPGLPREVDGFTNFCPLEAPAPSPMHKSHTFGYVTSVYKANSVKEGGGGGGGSGGGVYCVRRVQNFRLTNSKCMVLVEQWKKLAGSSNLVALRQVFTSKAFGDQSMLFVYDFYPGAETLMAKHFTQQPTFFDQFGFPTTDFASKLGSTSKFGGGMGGMGGGGGMGGFGGMGGGGGGKSSSHQLTQNGLLPESLIWTYVVQLTSALRHIHTAGLACRTLDPTKILVINRTRLLLNCCGMFDVLTFDPTASNPMAAMAHYQQEDLIALGKIVLALACNSFLAIQRENLQSSMELVTTNYSSDMRNLIMYLLTNPNRVKSVNDLMPMIGARFYVTLDESNKRIDMMECELSKEVESARLFRLLTKLCTVVDRAELNGDESWSEYGDRYMLKLFRDYVFHQVMEDGRPWLDMAHIVSCLNKFDTGVSDKICLMSRDEQNVLVVSYAELKQCLVQSYSECIQAAKPNLATAGAQSGAGGAPGGGLAAAAASYHSSNY